MSSLDHCGVCPACRRVVPLAAPCPADGERPLDLRAPADRAAMVDAVWGDVSARSALLAARPARLPGSARSALAASGLGLLFGLWGGLGSVELLIAGGAGALAGALVGAGRRPILVPGGGAPLPRGPRGASGTIVAADDVLAPGSGAVCAAWTLELRYEGRGPVRTLLRAGGTAGLELALDGDARARVPAGPVWIENVHAQLGDLEPSLDDLLDDLDPRRTRHDPWPLFPFNVALERTLHVGERVELLGDLPPRLVEGGAPTLYRDAPGVELQPAAAPVLRAL